jgi:hypothetical protein
MARVKQNVMDRAPQSGGLPFYLQCLTCTSWLQYSNKLWFGLDLADYIY